MTNENTSITKYCTVCGRKIEIIIHRDSSYEGGHYFGKMDIPLDPSQYRIIGENVDLFPGETIPIFEWTCECKTMEYWECDDCYHEEN